MIYFNNGATSWPKPSCVAEAVKKEIGRASCRERV